MEEDDTIIIQVIFKLEDRRQYTFDVDRTTTLYETKKILSNAAHILKNSFTLYYEGQEYSKEYDEQSLQKIFPNHKKIEFYLKLRKKEEELDENEHDQISVKYNIKEPCKKHLGKFLALYCVSCKKSICNECFSISHNRHEVEEKADYLMPAKILMERIFSNSFIFKSDPKLSNYMSCVSFRSIIKTEIFDKMRQLVGELENKCLNCLEFFSFNEDTTEKNNDLNLELLKKYFISSYIKLKNRLDTKEIMINDEVFLSLYNKLKAIKEYEINFFTENMNKYKALNSFYLPFTQEIKNMSMDLNNILTRYINRDIYTKFKEEISKNVVDVVQKDDIIRFMFENVNLPKKTSRSPLKSEENINKNSLTPNINHRLLPSILLLKDQKRLNTNNKMSIMSNAVNNINNYTNNNSCNNNTQNKFQNYQQSKENFTISSLFLSSKSRNNPNKINQNINNYSRETSVNARMNMNMNINKNLSNSNNETNIINKDIKLPNNNNIITSSQENMNLNLINTYANTNINTNINSNTNITTNINFNTNINNNINSNTNINTNINVNSNSNKNINTNINNNISDKKIENEIPMVVNDFSKSCALVQNISECNYDETIAKENKDSDKKLEKTDKMDIEEIGETPPTQNSPEIKQSEINYSQAKIDEIKANLSNKINVYASPMIKKKLISFDLSPSKIDDNFDNKSAIIPNIYIRQKMILKNAPKEINNIEISNTVKSKIDAYSVKNSINNINLFDGKLIDVLEKEKYKNNINNQNTELKTINEKKALSQKNLNCSPAFNLNISNANIPNDNLFSQNMNIQPIELNPSGSRNSVAAMFMYPVYKTHVVKGALDKNTVQEIQINFEEFSKDNLDINEFPTGGAYCNYQNYLFFTGGQEYIKGAGNIFLSISKNALNQSATKLPSMKYSHWNHSMIAKNGKIYVIGGYNSNKCEVYDIEKKIWSELPDLISKERQKSMLFIDKNNLYCFMGLSQVGILDTIEVLNLNNPNAGWVNLIVDNSEEVNLRFYGAGIIEKKGSNKIIFIGGKKINKKKEQVFKRSIYEFSFDGYKITCTDFKIENDLLFVESKLYPIDESDCGNFIDVGNGFLITMPNLVN